MFPVGQFIEQMLKIKADKGKETPFPTHSDNLRPLLSKSTKFKDDLETKVESRNSRAHGFVECSQEVNH